MNAIRPQLDLEPLLKITRIDNFSDFHDAVGGVAAECKIFRGVADVESHKLIPGVGRLSTIQRGNTGLRSYERSILKQFKQSALPFLTTRPQTELEWLAIAQHHGLPTRLLDWSYNPMVALFFATFAVSNLMCGVYCYRPRDKTIRTSDDIDPFEIKHVLKFSPDHYSDRIVSQMGLFTVHPEPREELKATDRLELLTFAPNVALDLRYALRRYGFSRASMFPGLDGVSAHVMER
ncbi:FRG domain-containing protein [Rhodobacteraceae bacterium M385]|nr:FRG domain-containing protein [Rhodobacteraceae bacterium M385]